MAKPRNKQHKTRSWLPLIHQSIKAHQLEERKQWDKVRAWLQGRYWTQTTGENEGDLLKSSINYAFALVETAASSLVPKNPQATVASRSPDDDGDQTARKIESWVNISLAQNVFKDEQFLSIQDVILYGRSIFKTTWDPKTNTATVRRLDPRTVLFDLTAQRTRDIRYYIELTYLTVDEFAARVGKGLYTLTNPDNMPNGGAYPEWFQEQWSPNAEGGADRFKELRDWEKWVPVYEVYDIDRKQVSHWIDGQDTPVMLDDEDFYCPYTLYYLNSNAQDCRGLSEILLVAPTIDDINRTLTYILNIIRRQIPRVAYDSTSMTADDVMKINTAPAGAWVPVKSQNGLPINGAFAPTPIPVLPPDVMTYLAKQESNLSFVSALAEAQRGQVTGARTATEMALIDQQLRNRLIGRQDRVDSALVDVVKKMIHLGSRYLPGTVSVRVGDGKGAEAWEKLSRKDIASIDVDVEVVPYSPIENNRAVLEERWMKMLEYTTQRENFDQRELDEEFVRAFKLNPKTLKPRPEDVPVETGAGTVSEKDVSEVAAQFGATPAEVLAAANGAQPSGLPPQGQSFADQGLVNNMRPALPQPDPTAPGGV